MKRAQSMAHAAWTRPRPSLRLSSWSCIGPRHRASTVLSNTKEDGNAQDFSSNADTSVSGETDIPLSSTEGTEWTSEVECSCSGEMGHHDDENIDIDNDDLIGNNRGQDNMNEVELWQQIEHELYEHIEDQNPDVVTEIREEEAAVIAEAGEDLPESSTPEMKEAHRFFPPGKIMHIITTGLPNEAESEIDATTSNELENNQPPETRVGIYLTPRTLYSKLRLSQTMISDHFMPVYRRQIEKLIRDFEKEVTILDANCNGVSADAVLLV